MNYERRTLVFLSKEGTPSVDFTNDYQMVRENLRVPKFYSIVFEREDKKILKRLKSRYKEVKKNKVLFKELNKEILNAFREALKRAPNFGGLVYNNKKLST